jgi:uncharacterized protein YecT (DUF1311 family)
MRLLLMSLAFISFNSFAQYTGPAADACRAYAKREAAREGASIADVVIERDSNLLIERYARKLGGQQVASILTGNGAVVFKDAPSAELSFICLLADEKRPLFFNWLPRQNVSALRQCTRDSDLAGKPRPCLETLLQVAEFDLSQVYAQTFQEANEAGETVLAAYRRSNKEWLEYRDAECARRRSEEARLACTIDLTRRRILDARP